MVSSLSTEQVAQVLGNFPFEEAGGGLVKIDFRWLNTNLVTSSYPVVGLLKTHKKVQSILLNIFTTIESNKLGQFVTLKSGGCSYCPRHQWWDRRRPLSLHCWGLPIDLNVVDNPYGLILDKPMSFNLSNYGTSEVIKIFEDNGYIWGGRFEKPDSKHFEPSLELLQSL